MKIKRFILLAFSGCCLALSGAACSGLEGDNSDFDFGDMTSDAPDNPYDGQGYDRLPNSVRLATYNTHRCEGWTQNSGTDRANYNNTAKVISLMAPDVIALQELDKNTTWHPTDQLQELADRTGAIGHGGIDRQHGGRFGGAVAFEDADAEFFKPQLAHRLRQLLGAGDHIAHAEEVVRVGVFGIVAEEGAGAKEYRAVAVVDHLGDHLVVQG